MTPPPPTTPPVDPVDRAAIEAIIAEIVEWWNLTGDSEWTNIAAQCHGTLERVRLKVAALPSLVLTPATSPAPAPVAEPPLPEGWSIRRASPEHNDGVVIEFKNDTCHIVRAKGAPPPSTSFLFDGHAARIVVEAGLAVADFIDYTDARARLSAHLAARPCEDGAKWESQYG